MKRSVLLSVGLLLTACNLQFAASTAVPAASTGPTSTPQPTTAPIRVKIFLVAIGDKGAAGQQIGCGDSLVAVEREANPSGSPEQVALTDLLSIRTQFYGQSGLYNALYQSDLSVQSLSTANGILTVNLTGRLQLGGVCDDPRVEAQLTATASQFSSADTVRIFINGVPLKDALSEK